jgi:hypothetical protein
MIPIFEGKQATYNKAILEALLTEGEMSAWQLAKHITPKIETVKRTLASTETQKVYSVLVRNEGRLNDLKGKEYISLNEETQKWEIAAKGIIAICIEKPQLKPLINLQYWNNHVIGNFKIPKEKMEIPLVGITVDGEVWGKHLSNLLSKFKAGNVSTVDRIVGDAKKLIDEGVNLDKISTRSLIQLLWTKAMQNHNTEPLF